MLQSGQAVKTLSGRPEELELSEADKRFTQQLLDEAKKVSTQSKHRGKLSKRRSGSGKLEAWQINRINRLITLMGLITD